MTRPFALRGLPAVGDTCVHIGTLKGRIQGCEGPQKRLHRGKVLLKGLYRGIRVSVVAVRFLVIGITRE